MKSTVTKHRIPTMKSSNHHTRRHPARRHVATYIAQHAQRVDLEACARVLALATRATVSAPITSASAPSTGKPPSPSRRRTAGRSTPS
jgi:hypothetical protein